MAVTLAYKSDIGRNPKRKNEDYIWVNEAMGLYIVADGMGGQEAGEVASEMAATTIADYISRDLGALTDPPSAETIAQIMSSAIEVANEAVSKAAQAAEQRRKMGATIVVALLHNAKAYISHAGDARAYLVRGGTIMQLTRDDSWSAELEAEGVITRDQAENHPFGHIVTKAIGQGSDLAPSFAEFNLTPGDWLLLCSDGLWNMLSDEEILTIIKTADGQPEQAVEALVAAANEAGGKDNISVVALKMAAET